MKTLSKLSINPEKVLRNDELKNLKGGEQGNCWAYYQNGSARLYSTYEIEHYDPNRTQQCESYFGSGWNCNCD